VCETDVFLDGESGLSLVMSDAVLVSMDGSTATVTDALGRSTALENVELKQASFLNHRIVLRRVRDRRK